MFNGIRIVPDGLHIVATATQLIVNNVQSDDEGSYGCVVTNAYGTRQSSSVLTIGAFVTAWHCKMERENFYIYCILRNFVVRTFCAQDINQKFC